MPDAEVARTAELQQHCTSRLTLLTATIALWNTVDLGHAIAPLGWQHINLTGDYLWGASSGLGPDGFRPLRNSRHVLATPPDACTPSR